jgi:hypothetical protein|tara:strand:+ start:204 stop:353 length:150 start_codon:yes stop_codon:yes gene_type:complete
LEQENTKVEDETWPLKKIYIDEPLKAEIAKGIIVKSGEARSMFRAGLQG